MKRLALVFLFLFALIGEASAVGCTGTGNCYWVGGTGNWSDTTKWATTDGGVTTGGLPSATDNVNFTALSNTTAYTVTMDVTGSCLDMTWALPSISGVPTFTTTSFSVNVFGSLTLVAGMLMPGGTNFGFGFQATSVGKTITTAGVVINASILFGGNGGGWTLQDNLAMNAARSITVSNGTLNTNAKTITTGFFVSTTGTRTLTLTNSTINLTGASGTLLNLAGSFSAFTSTGSTFNLSGGTSGTGSGFTPGGQTFATFNITGPGLFTMNNSGTFGAFSYVSTTNKTDSLILGGSVTVSSGGTLNIAGNSVVNRAFVRSTIFGSARNIIVSGGTTPTLTNVDFQDITAFGNTPWTGTSLGDALGNTSITFDGSTTQTATTASALNYSNAAIWTSRVPLPQDDVVIGAGLTASGAVTTDMPRLGRNIDTSALTKTIFFSITANAAFGNVILGAGGTYSGTQVLTLAGRGTHTVTSNGKTFPQSLTFSAFGGTYTLQDNFATAGQITLTDGILDDGDFSVVLPAGFGSTVTTARTLRAGGIWDISTTSATRWSVTSSLTLTARSSWQIKFTGTVTTNITFAGAGLTYANFYWSNTASTGTLIVTGANTFADFKVDGTTARIVQFPASTVTTLNTLTQSNPTLGQLTTLNSSTPGTRATLQSMGPRNSLSLLSITDINALGGAGWFAGNRSTNGSNNYGWQFRRPAHPSNWRKHSANDNFMPDRMAA